MEQEQCTLAWCNNTDVVHSGVDALVLGGIPTGWYCTQCAKTYVTIRDHIITLNGGNN